MRTPPRLFGRKPTGIRSTQATGFHAEWDDSPSEPNDVVQETLRIAAKCCDEKRYSQALVALKKAQSSFPDDKDLIYARSCALIAWGRYWEARRWLLKLYRSESHRADLLVRLGWTYLAHGDFQSAEVYMRRAISSAPGDWEAHYGLGEVLRNCDTSAAKQSFASALTASPDNLHCLINLSASSVALKDPVAAEEYARRAVLKCRTSAPAWTNLGVALLLQDRLIESGDAFARAEQLTHMVSSPADNDLNLGTVLQLRGKTREAIEYFETMLPRHPSAAASGHYALTLLTAGRFNEGWAQYEFRWLDPQLSSQRAKCTVPAWNGQDISGRIVLLRCEQGIGDVIQFIRYAPLVKLRRATVWLELRPGIGALARAFPGIDRIFNAGDFIPEYDYYADLLSLPRILRTTPSSVPSDVPYLRAPDRSRAHWHARFEEGATLKIGLVWAGDPNHVRDRQRSVPFATLAPLIAVGGVRWFSLQKGRTINASGHSEFSKSMIDLGPDLHGLADTAAAIEELDLVVTVDTSVAHLAGALGKPVWLLLPVPADWRWMEEREDTPWYPTMRLFRQRSPGDWEDVIQRVSIALISLMNGRRGIQTEPSADRKVAITKAPVGEMVPADGPASIPGIPRACRIRSGMIQYIAGSEPFVQSLEHYGEYLHARTELLKRWVVPGFNVIEIGAGIGLDTIALSSMVTPGGNVLAFENSVIFRRVLRQNLNANDVKCVEVIESAIVSRARRRSDTATVEAELLDQCECSVDDLQLEQIDLLKVGDPKLVQDVFDGGQSTLWQHRPVLFLALDSPDALARHAERAADLGYRCWSVESPLFNPSNFNRRDDDIFFGNTALAIIAVPEERDPGITLAHIDGLCEVSRA